MADGGCERLGRLRRLREEREDAFRGGDFELCGELREREREAAVAAKAELRRMMDDVHREDGDYALCAEYKRCMQAIDDFVGQRRAAGPAATAEAAAASSPGLSAAPSEAEADAAAEGVDVARIEETVAAVLRAEEEGEEQEEEAAAAEEEEVRVARVVRVVEAARPAAAAAVQCAAARKEKGRPKLSARGPATKKDIDSILALSWSEALSAFPTWRAYLSEENRRRRELHKATGSDSFGRRVRAAFDQKGGAIRDHIANCIGLFRAEQAAGGSQGCGGAKPAGPPAHSKQHVTLLLSSDKWVQVKRGDVQLAAAGQRLPPAGSRQTTWWCGFESTRRRCKHVRPLVATEPGQKAAEFDGQHDCKNFHLKKGLVHYYVSRVNQPAE